MSPSEWLRCALLAFIGCLVVHALPARADFTINDLEEIRDLISIMLPTQMFERELRHGQYWVLPCSLNTTPGACPDGDRTNRGPELTAAQTTCLNGVLGNVCDTYFAPGAYWADQIVMQQWGSSFRGAGTNRTVIHQFLDGVNTDLIRHKKTNGTTGDASQHWFEISGIRLRKGTFGDPLTTDTKGSGINFCVGEQGETSVIRDVFISGFPDAGVRYGCETSYYSEGDPTPPFGSSNGGYVPAYLENVAVFGNGRAGIYLDRKRLVTSRFTASEISGDGNGWRVGQGALVEIDGGCGGGNVCGESINFRGLKSEVGTYQTCAILMRQMIGELVVAENISHKGSSPLGDTYAVCITDDTPGASPGGGARFKGTVAGLFLTGYLKDDSRAVEVIVPAHHTVQAIDHDPWRDAAEWDYCGATWKDGFDHVVGPGRPNEGELCTCYLGNSVMRNEYWKPNPDYDAETNPLVDEFIPNDCVTTP